MQLSPRPGRTTFTAAAWAGEDHPDRARHRRRPDLHWSRPARLNGEAQIKVSHLAIGPTSPARARDERKARGPRGPLIIGGRAEAIHEMEVRPRHRGGLHDDRRLGRDLDNHHAGTALTGPQRTAPRGGPAAIMHITLLAAVDKPQRAGPQAPGPPRRTQRAPVRRIAGEQLGTRGRSWRRRPSRQRNRPPRPDSSMAATPAGQHHRGESSNETSRCHQHHHQPAPGGKPEIPLGTLADLVQPSHLLRHARRDHSLITSHTAQTGPSRARDRQAAEPADSAGAAGPACWILTAVPHAGHGRRRPGLNSSREQRYGATATPVVPLSPGQEPLINQIPPERGVVVVDGPKQLSLRC